MGLEGGGRKGILARKDHGPSCSALGLLLKWNFEALEIRPTKLLSNMERKKTNVGKVLSSLIGTVSGLGGGNEKINTGP